MYYKENFISLGGLGRAFEHVSPPTHMPLPKPSPVKIKDPVIPDKPNIDGTFKRTHTDGSTATVKKGTGPDGKPNESVTKISDKSPDHTISSDPANPTKQTIKTHDGMTFTRTVDPNTKVITDKLPAGNSHNIDTVITKSTGETTTSFHPQNGAAKGDTLTTHSDGSKTMTYGADGTTRQITPMKDANGNSIPYKDTQTTGNITQEQHFDQNGNITHTIHTDNHTGNVATFDNNNKLTTYRDNQNNQTTHYQSDGSATIKSDPLPTGHQTGQDYHPDGTPNGPVKVVDNNGKNVFDGTPRHPDGTPKPPVNPDENGWSFKGMLNDFALYGGVALTAYGLYEVGTSMYGKPQYAAVNPTTGDVQNITTKTNSDGSTVASVVCPPGVNPSDFPSGCVLPDATTPFESVSPSGSYTYMIPPANFSFPTINSVNIPRGTQKVPGGPITVNPGTVNPVNTPNNASGIIPGVDNSYLYIIGGGFCGLICCLFFLILIFKFIL